jgi:DNA end-binding protein Ku
MRAMWTGSLSFGLINIPVKLYSGAEDRGGIELNMLHKEDLSPIRYAKICRLDGKELAMDDIVKGYEYQTGDYVVLSDDDFAKANSKRTKTIEIQEFTDEEQLDVRYFEKPYYLEPDKNANKPYALLREALSRSHKIAVAKFVLRNREHLAAIKPVGRALILNQLRFPSDLREPRQLDLPDASEASTKEVDMALKLIDQLTGPFVAEDYKDTYTEELQTIIDAKVAGRQVAPGEALPAATPAKDLMAMLKESLEKERAKSGGS